MSIIQALVATAVAPPAPTQVSVDVVNRRTFSQEGIHTWSHTVAADATYLIAIGGTGGDNSANPPTFNGVTMSLLGTISGPGVVYSYVYGLASPAVGAHNLVWNDGGLFGGGYSISFIGATGATTNTTSGSGENASIGISSFDSSIVIGLAAYDAAHGGFYGSGTHTQLGDEFFYDGAVGRTSQQNTAVAPTTTMAWQVDQGLFWSVVVVSVNT